MSEDTDFESKEDFKRIDEALKTLGNYFDSVHIFTTRHEGG